MRREQGQRGQWLCSCGAGPWSTPIQFVLHRQQYGATDDANSPKSKHHAVYRTPVVQPQQ